MSRFLSRRYTDLTPYVPGEQPSDRRYVKLNTNEMPFPPGAEAVKWAQENCRSFELYNDPEAIALRAALAENLHVPAGRVMVTNGSDEMLQFAMVAFASEDRPAIYPDISYGFYQVYASVCCVPSRAIPLDDDFCIRPEDYAGVRGVIFLANPNAPTGLALSRGQIEQIVRSAPQSIVVVDEAYVDFGGESAVPLIDRYDNLLVVRTFSKSRSMAGARLGFGVAQEGLIRDLQTVRYSLSPYNVNSFTQALGIAVLRDEARVQENCRTIMENRRYLAQELALLGFRVIPSSANFVFAMHPAIDGETLYYELKKRGVLIRHFNSERIRQYNRITVGTREQLDVLLDNIRGILGV